MKKITTLNWFLITALGGLALVRPLVRIVEDQANLTHHAASSIVITIGISIVWIAVVGLSRVAEPVLTLLFTGLAYGVLSSILSAILSPILLGHLDGPLANPVRLLPALAINAIWGLLAGAIALGLRQVRRVRSD
ncbi:hypothetical protein [Microlunatus soli]|uniref:Uncharacterized protein n=1 Tax=Microlunatus soli TaxID=630515 RepID=A0A1H1WIT5_9ACTN|nr:hypothetical protein [Microlunatus soli]SDS96109.1 hypothetical protein SAMN04489812_3639 [Microlunatus soli]